MVEIIAELGINHNGDTEIAKKLIDVAYTAGCHYVKFQKRDVETVYSKEELDTPRQSPFGTTTREQKYGIELTLSQYDELIHYCGDRIKWFASPWDVKSLNDLVLLGCPIIKIPSALITNIPLLEAAKKSGIPVILSAGMSTLEQVDKAISIVGPDQIMCIMHCTSTYPTTPNEINIKCLETFEKRYPWTKIGFSNHYPGLMALLLAVSYGAEMIEFHITLDRAMYGSDQAASIEPRGVFELVQRVKIAEAMIGDGEKVVFDSEVPIIKKLRR